MITTAAKILMTLALSKRTSFTLSLTVDCSFMQAGHGLVLLLGRLLFLYHFNSKVFKYLFTISLEEKLSANCQEDGVGR